MQRLANPELSKTTGLQVKEVFLDAKRYARQTHKQDKHSILIDYDMFQKVTAPDPSDPRKLYKPDDFDFRLQLGSAAVDAGVQLPNVNDDFTGRAPDLGAYEIDRPLPHYGPRP